MFYSGQRPIRLDTALLRLYSNTVGLINRAALDCAPEMKHRLSAVVGVPSPRIAAASGKH